MALTGDFPKLAAMQQSIKRLVQVPSRVAGPVATDLNALIQRNWSAGVDPYGQGWAPRKSGRGGWPILDRTGALRGSTLAKALGGAGIAITVGASYGGFHQFGTSYLPVRRIIPSGTLPAAWDAVIKARIELEFRKAAA